MGAVLAFPMNPAEDKMVAVAFPARPERDARRQRVFLAALRTLIMMQLEYCPDFVLFFCNIPWDFPL